MNVHRLRALDDIPARFAAPPVELDAPDQDYTPPPGSWLAPLRIRLRMILGLVVAAMAIAAFLVLRTPSTYTASTAIMIQAPTDKARDGSAATTVENQIQILTSATLAQRVVKSLNLERDEEFAGSKQTGIAGTLLSLVGWRERVASTRQPQGVIDPIILQRFASKLDVAVQGNSTVVRIQFGANGPTKAARIANAITTIYLGTLPTPDSAAVPTNDRLPQLAAQARADEEAVAQYKASNPFGATAPTSEQPGDVAQEVVAARANVATLENKFRQLNTAYHSGGADAAAPLITSMKLTQLRGRLADLTKQEVELSAKYGEKHPQMIALKGEQTEVKKQIDEEVRRHVQSLGGQLNAARARLNNLEQAQPTPAAPAGPVNDARLQELERRAAASRGAYEAALAGPAPAAEPLANPIAKLIEAATIPRTPSAPARLFIMGTTFGGSLLIAVLLAFWLERPRNAFRDEREIEAMTRVANFAVIPNARGRNGAVERVVRKPRSAFAEAIRSLHAGIQLLRSGPPKVLLVTSSIPDEGKTSVAVALGRLVARTNARVILVDCDLRHPSVADQFPGPKTELGLTDVLTDGGDLGLILRRDPMSSLEFLPVTRPSANPAQLITSQALKNLIDVLRQHYDLVILDAAPVLPVADTRMLTRLADKAIYVVEWNKTPREAVLSGIAMLRNAGTEVAATVLNKADMRRHAIYGYGLASHSHGYGGRYYAE